MDDGLLHIFNKSDAKRSLGTKFIGKKIYSYDWVTSTNDIAHFFARKNEGEGTCFFARGQTEGRGRHGNVWMSPYGDGLYFSFILRPFLKSNDASRVTLTVALSVIKALEELHVDNLSLKWPNDVLIKEKKVCGILTEMSLEGECAKYIVVGVGLNVNTSLGELPETATSLKLATGRTFDIADLSHIIIKHIDREYDLLLERPFLEIINEVKRYSGLVLGGRVRITWQDRVIEGYALDFDEHGGLVIRKDNGVLERVHAGHLEKL